MQVTPINSVSSELVSNPLRSQSRVQRTVDPQEEAAFAQLASVGSQEPASAGAATDSNGGKKVTLEDVNKAIASGVVNNIMTQENEARTKLEKVMRGEDPE